jgi:phage gpG-like protein
MAGVTIEVQVNDQVSPLLQRIETRLGALKPAMKIIGETVRTSIVRNFEKEGRPVGWKQLSPLTVARRGTAHPILRRQGFAGGLMGSISARAYDDRVELGTNKVSAAVHQLGAKKGSFGIFDVTIREHVRRIAQAFGKAIQPRDVTVRSHKRKTAIPWGDIPARPFMMVQPEDWDEIRLSLVDYLILKGGRRA